MTGAERRKRILAMIKEAAAPISGAALGAATGVSRQIIVQDIALLRTEGHNILATARGYILLPTQQKGYTRLFKVYHDETRTEEELNTVVDLGGCVENVMVNHRIYGKVSAPLNIKTRRDIKSFLTDLKLGKSLPLLNVTSGYHFHRICADEQEILDEIEETLRQKGFLTEVFPYEKEE